MWPEWAGHLVVNHRQRKLVGVGHRLLEAVVARRDGVVATEGRGGTRPTDHSTLRVLTYRVCKYEARSTNDSRPRTELFINVHLLLRQAARPNAQGIWEARRSSRQGRLLVPEIVAWSMLRERIS